MQSDLEVKLLNRGLNGDLTSGMLERFPRDVVFERADYVIILGGTNDIGWGIDPSTITRNLTNMYDIALTEGIRVVACSVPSILGFDDLIPPRLGLNKMIRMEAQTRGIVFVDLFTQTADSRTNRLLEDFSADGLHLNSKGYQHVAQCIFGKWLKPLLDEVRSGKAFLK